MSDVMSPCQPMTYPTSRGRKNRTSVNERMKLVRNHFSTRDNELRRLTLPIHVEPPSVVRVNSLLSQKDQQYLAELSARKRIATG